MTLAPPVAENTGTPTDVAAAASDTMRAPAVRWQPATLCALYNAILQQRQSELAPL